MLTTDKSRENLSRTRYQKQDQGLTSELELWKAVLFQAILDCASQNDKERLEVAQWVDTQDFDTVCEFADMNAPMLAMEINNLLSLPTHALRKHYSKILRKAVQKN